MSKGRVMSFDDLPLVLNVQDIAGVLGVSKNTVYELVHSKDFPKITIGKQYRVPREKFLAWLDACGTVA